MSDVNASRPCWIFGHDSGDWPSIPFDCPPEGWEGRWVSGPPPPWLVTNVPLKERVCPLHAGINNNRLNPAYAPSRGITSSSGSEERKAATRSPLEEPYGLYSSVMFVKKAIFPDRVIPNQVPPARMSMPERMLGWEWVEKEWK